MYSKWCFELCVQDEEGTMDGDVDTVVKTLIETESHFKELSAQYDQHFDRWTSFTQVGALTLYVQVLLSTYIFPFVALYCKFLFLYDVGNHSLQRKNVC